MKLNSVVFGLCMVLFNMAWATTEQQAFDEGTAYGESQIESAMNTLKGLNAADIGTRSPDASQSAEQALSQSASQTHATVDNNTIQEGEAIESNAPQAVQSSGGFCTTGDCKDTQTTPSDDFDQSGSELSSVSSAGEDIQEEQKNSHIRNPNIATHISVKSFGGFSVSCTYDSASIKNCCANKGAGISIGLSCSSTEKNLAKAVQDDRVVEVGTYCSKKVPLVGCVEHKKVYCQFNSLLDRIMQTDGRSGQLHISFGQINDDNHEANCRGMMPDEMERVIFDQCDATHSKPNCIDYTEYYQELESQMTVPT